MSLHENMKCQKPEIMVTGGSSFPWSHYSKAFSLLFSSFVLFFLATLFLFIHIERAMTNKKNNSMNILHCKLANWEVSFRKTSEWFFSEWQTQATASQKHPPQDRWYLRNTTLLWSLSHPQRLPLLSMILYCLRKKGFILAHDLRKDIHHGGKHGSRSLRQPVV